MLLIALAFSGCGSSNGGKPAADRSNAQRTMTDPCAMRLHDLAGALLLYHASHGSLPATLEELRNVPGAIAPLESFACPVSKAPYRYEPAGLSLRGRVARVILFDATAAHDGKRWAVEVPDSAPDEPLVTKVVSLPESAFH
jgi:hypothetical protein